MATVGRDQSVARDSPRGKERGITIKAVVRDELGAPLTGPVRATCQTGGSAGMQRGPGRRVPRDPEEG